ncbi:MAG: hypothetical protein ABJA66_14360 [Actinomycetota bacterium]
MTDSLDSLFETLAHSSDAEIGSLIYRGETLSDGALQACANVLNIHFRAPDADGRLIEKSRHSSGKFMLLVLAPTWKDQTEENVAPLIVTSQNGEAKIAGVMLPFNDLIPDFPKDDRSEMDKLSAIWIMRKLQARGN